MRASVICALEAVSIALIGGLSIALFCAPTYSDRGFSIAWLALPYFIFGALVGLVGYGGVWFARQTWGNAIFRFSMRDIVWFTSLISVLLGTQAAWRNERRSTELRHVEAMKELIRDEMAEETYLEVGVDVDEIFPPNYNWPEAREWLKQRRERQRYFFDKRAEAVRKERRDAHDQNSYFNPAVEAAIEKSKELGAPQPKPLPPGYGEQPNHDSDQ